jgi:hypothetical protein
LPVWAWILIALAVIAVIVGLIAIFSSGDANVTSDGDEDATDTTVAETTTTTAETTTTVAETTTTVAETTTTVAETTTTVAETTTSAAAGGSVVEPTAVSAVLGTDLPPYGPVELFPPGSVAADWYQWDGFYVVLYRGLVVTDPLCPGNSIQTPTAFENITNSPVGGPDACVGATNLAGEGFGARQCGDLTYYLTEIPTDIDGGLFGTVELFDASGEISGATSAVGTNLAATPQFEPGLSSYELPPSDLDDLTTVTC